MLSNNVLSVSQVNNYITAIFKAEELLHDIAVSGEVSNFTVRNGYAYFAIKDENAVLSCTCFSLAGNYIPKDGEKVLLIGSVSYYGKSGKISLIAKKIAALGQGALSARFEALRKKLASEGIFAEEHKKNLPLFPLRIGVITSKTGAVIRDIKTTVFRKNPYADIYVFDVRVQGEGAASEIKEAIEFADSLNYDVLIVARGGGSFEDLLPFFDEDVTRAVYNAVTPIISAVGHETDVTFCDFAADLRVPTPTAAGEAASFNYYETLSAIKNSLNYIYGCVEDKRENCLSELRVLVGAINSNAFATIARECASVRATAKRIEYAVNTGFNEAERMLERLTAKISIENPMSVLNKGAFYAFSNEKRINENNISIGDKISFVGKSQVIEALVENKYSR